MEHIRCEQDGAIAIVTIDRPHALNALNASILKDLYQTMDVLDGDHSVRVVILTGSGEKAFAAGADIASMRDMTPAEALDFAQLGQRTMDRIATMKKPTIAAVNGYALGGGCELAIACDIRVASAKAKMGIPEVTLGVLPCFGGTQRLPRLIGPGMAMELLSTGRQCGAQECKEIGLVNQVVRAEELMDTCIKMAETIAHNGSFSIALGKQCIYSAVSLPIEKGLELERNAFAETFTTSDPKEGMSAFLEKRSPLFI